MKLTQKQKLFADYYISSGNGTESAIKAGYSKKTACEMGHENLRKPHIVEYIKERNDKLESERVADMQEVRELWSKILRNQVEGVEMKDILKASEYIAKTNGAFLDKVEHKGDLGLNITIDYGDDDE